jgi:hypothetical protein
MGVSCVSTLFIEVHLLHVLFPVYLKKKANFQVKHGFFSYHGTFKALAAKKMLELFLKCNIIFLLMAI